MQKKFIQPSAYVTADGNWGGSSGMFLFSYEELTDEECELLENDPEGFYDYLLEQGDN